MARIQTQKHKCVPVVLSDGERSNTKQKLKSGECRYAEQWCDVRDVLSIDDVFVIQWYEIGPDLDVRFRFGARLPDPLRLAVEAV